jgi:hypothetical protein
MVESEFNQKGVAMRRRILADAAVERGACEIDSDPIIRSCRISAESGSQC